MVRQVDYWLTVYKRTWKGSIVTSFVSPLFYVLAMGVLLGGFVHVEPRPARGRHVVPRLRRARPDRGPGDADRASFETTYPVMGAIKWHKTLLRPARHARWRSATSPTRC